MKIPVIFRFDASPEIGFGHAMRCLALAQALIKLNVNCLVVACHFPESLQPAFTQLGINIITIDVEVASAEDTCHLIELIKKHQSRLVVLDGYQFDQCYQLALQQQKVQVGIFDDINQMPNLYCDLLINALPTAKQLGYEESAANAEHLLGLDYSLLRDEFTSQKPLVFAEKTHLLINFGGSDVLNLTLPVLNALLVADSNLLPEQLLVVTGAACSDVETIQQLSIDLGFQHFHHCDDMALLLNKSRLAICAAGTIVYELAYCGVPSVFFSIADNQLLSAEAHHQADWCFSYDGRKEGQLALGVEKAKQLWTMSSQLEQMSENAAKLVDGRGAERLARIISGRVH